MKQLILVTASILSLLAFATHAFSQLEVSDPKPVEASKDVELPVNQLPDSPTGSGKVSGEEPDAVKEAQAFEQAIMDSMTGANEVKPTEIKKEKTDAYDYDSNVGDPKLKDQPTSLPKASIQQEKAKAKAPVDATKKNSSVGKPNNDKNTEIGKNSVPRPFVIKEINEDEYSSSAVESPETENSDGKVGHKSLFFRGSVIEDDARKQEKVVYQYVSRGAWLIVKIQPFFDRLAAEVIRADRSEMISGFVELSRTYVYLCSLIASDDGSKEYERKAAEAVSLHREALGQLRMRWSGKSPELVRLFDEYMKTTFFRDLNKDLKKIRAGELVRSKYETLSERNSDLGEIMTDRESGQGAATPINLFKRN